MKIVSFALIWVFLASSVLIDSNISQAIGTEDKRWSLSFNNVVVSDALRELTKITGVKIIVPSRIDNKPLTRSYVNQTLEEILKDIFRNMNYASLWYYNENRLDTIDIWIFDGGLRDSGDSAGAGRRKSEASSVERDFDAKRPFNRGLRKGENFSETHLAPDNRESGTLETEEEPSENENADRAEDTQGEAKDSRQSINDEAPASETDTEETSASEESGADADSPKKLPNEEERVSLPSG